MSVSVCVCVCVCVCMCVFWLLRPYFDELCLLINKSDGISLSHPICLSLSVFPSSLSRSTPQRSTSGVSLICSDISVGWGCGVGGGGGAFPVGAELAVCVL